MIIQTVLLLIIIACASLSRSSLHTSDLVNEPLKIASGDSDVSGIASVSSLLKPEKTKNVSEYSSEYQYCGEVPDSFCKKIISTDIQIVALHFLSTRLLL